ncbi:MAG: hypothetical protein AAB890_02525 [Patescibacteria group bacterium]
MTPEELKKFEAILLQKKKELEQELKDTPLVTEMGSDVEGGMFDEEADEAEEMGANYSIKKSLTKTLGSVNAALEKIKNNAYGKCEQCGNAIEIEILEADPESHLCKRCKEL